MKILIMGCGRVGAWLARSLDADGHTVTVLDTDAYSFRRLRFPGLVDEFKGTALVGNGTDQEVLEKAGIKNADVFIALTEGDNRNIMACEIARQVFKVPRVICRIYDPLRQELYNNLGIEAFSPTTIFANILKDTIEK
jgi:trk system potassium uptake protein